MYRLHEEMLQHPEHWNYDAQGAPIRVPGDGSFPQPKEGMLTFNFSTQANRDFWANACINMTKVWGAMMDRRCDTFSASTSCSACRAVAPWFTWPGGVPLFPLPLLPLPARRAILTAALVTEATRTSCRA